MPVIYEPRGRAREYAPLAANLYSGCAHGCKYCYAPDVLRRSRDDFHSVIAVRSNILAELTEDARRLSGANARVLLSFTTDPYQPIEAEQRITRQAIEILHEHGLAVEVLTKGGARAARDFDLLGKGDAFATTLTFLDAGRSREWEPYAAAPEERIDVMRFAHQRGIPVWVSLEPVIDPEESLELIRRTAPFVDLFKVGTLNHHPLAKAIDWAGFGAAAETLLQALGKDYYIKDDLRAHMKRSA